MSWSLLVEKKSEGSMLKNHSTETVGFEGVHWKFDAVESLHIDAAFCALFSLIEISA